MLSFFASRLGAYVLIVVILALVIGGMLLHMHLTANTVANLQETVVALTDQAKQLEVADQALKSDVARVQQAQQAADQALSDVRVQTTAAIKAIRNRSFTAGSSTTQTQANQETAETFRRLEAVSQ